LHEDIRYATLDDEGSQEGINGYSRHLTGYHLLMLLPEKDCRVEIAEVYDEYKLVGETQRDNPDLYLKEPLVIS
jgi:hypothetical protein